MGIGMEGIDMPFTKYGLRPDLIMNPNAVPSRMTIGQLWECIMGKVGALQGMNMDGTAFEDYDLEAIKNMLEKLGYQRNCEEYLYNGMTGKMIKHMIFIGPTYYQRLKHMTQDKVHCLSADHDVLTDKGWIPIADITKSHSIAIMRDGNVSYTNPLEIHHYRAHDRKIITINYADGKIMQKITDEHRIYASVSGSEYQLIRISDLIGNNINGQFDNIKMMDSQGEPIDGPFTYNVTRETVPVYCLSVENERFIVRYNEHNNSTTNENITLGDGVWTGNSRARGPVTILTHQAPEGG